LLQSPVLISGELELAKLKYASNAMVDFLRDNIEAHLPRYTGGEFADLPGECNIDLRIEADLAPLSDLDSSGRAEAEIRNSELVWRALHAVTPVLAYEEGLWVRLTHIECLQFARSRWLKAENDKAGLAKSVGLHFFANSLTKRRDDNAISRLWWNAFIANRIAPSDRVGALKAILKSADIRSNIVERSQTASRRALCAGIVRAIRNFPQLTGAEDDFRRFMKELNRQGGGAVFEAMSQGQIDSFVWKCAKTAGAVSVP
jgi:hypothetical protein